MTIKFLSQKAGNSKLILFLNGWGMNEAAIRNLGIPEGYDLLVVYDYRSFTGFPPEVSHYQEIILVAWSIGVWATEQLAQRELLPSVKQSIAMAGSPFIRHDSYGIPCKIFDLTLQTLTDSSRETFNRRMCGGKSNGALLKEFEQRTTQELQEELNAVHNAELNRGSERLTFHWDMLFIAEKDKIIPPRNLLCLAEKFQIPAISLPSLPHFLFAGFHSWQDLFELIPLC